jgi:hypothetical protein
MPAGINMRPNNEAATIIRKTIFVIVGLDKFTHIFQSSYFYSVIIQPKVFVVSPIIDAYRVDNGTGRFLDLFVIMLFSILPCNEDERIF